MPDYRYVEGYGPAAMLTTKRLAGFAPEVNLRDDVICVAPPSVNKAAHSDVETQKRHHQKFKTGVSVAPQKGLPYPESHSTKTFIGEH